MSTFPGTPSSSRTPAVSTSTAVIPFADRQRSLHRQVVLEEDEYTAALSHIIARDFFPSLHQLDATNNYLLALDSGDSVRISDSVRELAALTEPTPVGRSGWADTPSATSRHGLNGKKRTHEEMYGAAGLDDFQARFTSEDNASFVEILDEENKKKKERWAWAYKAEEGARRKVIEYTQKRQRLIEPLRSSDGGEQKLITETGEREEQNRKEKRTEEERAEDDDEASVLALVLDTDKDKQVVQSTSTSTPAKPTEEPESAPWDPDNILSRTVDKRSASVPTWDFKARNSFMFPPDANVSPFTPAAPSAAPGNVAGASTDKVINYSNTRLLEFDEESGRIGEPPSPSRSRIDAAIAGAPFRGSALSSAGSASEASGPPGSYPLVDAIPSPSPSMLGPERLKQLMTWGTLAATPRALSTDDDVASGAAGGGASPFTIARPTSRDALAHRLGTTASRGLRERAALFNATPYSVRSDRTPGSIRTPSRRGSMPPPSSTPKREETLSAAARNLLGKAGGGSRSSLGEVLNRTAARRRAEVMSRSGGWGGVVDRSAATPVGGRAARWTPSPSPKRREDN